MAHVFEIPTSNSNNAFLVDLFELFRKSEQQIYLFTSVKADLHLAEFDLVFTKFSIVLISYSIFPSTAKMVMANL